MWAWKQVCDRCNRARHDLSGALCRFCYRLRARLKYYDTQEWVDHWLKTATGGWDESGAAVGVTYPTVEWWDERDIPAVPKRIARIEFTK